MSTHLATFDYCHNFTNSGGLPLQDYLVIDSVWFVCPFWGTNSRTKIVLVEGIQACETCVRVTKDRWTIIWNRRDFDIFKNDSLKRIVFKKKKKKSHETLEHAKFNKLHPTVYFMFECTILKVEYSLGGMLLNKHASPRWISSWNEC